MNHPVNWGNRCFPTHPARSVTWEINFPSETALSASVGEVAFWGALEVQS